MVSKEKSYVQFENIQKRYFIDDGKPMLVEYFISSSEFRSSTKDIIGIFPKGWRSLEQQLVGEYVLPSMKYNSDYKKDNISKRIIDIDLSYLLSKINCFNADYQLVYITKYLQVVGRSSYFRLQRIFNDVHSHGDNAGVFEGTGTSLVSTNLPATCSIPSLKPCSPSNTFVQTVNCRGIGYPLVRPYRSECMLPLPAHEFIPPCRLCPERLEQIYLKDKQVKDLAEINRNLRKKLVESEQKLELSIGAQKWLKLSCHYVREEKHSYEVFVNKLLDHLRGNSLVCVRDKGSEMLVQRIGSDIDNHLVHMSLRHPPNDRYLKAIIGNQEMKIRNLLAQVDDLTSKLNQYKMISFHENEVITHNNVAEILPECNMVLNKNANNHCSDTKNQIVEINRFTRQCYSSSERIEARVKFITINEKSQAVLYDTNNNLDINGSEESKEEGDTVK